MNMHCHHATAYGAIGQFIASSRQTERVIPVAKMLCKCANLMSTTEVPNDVELRVYTDREWVEKIESQDTVNTWELPFPEHTVWRCPKCERIHVFGTGDDREKVIRVYVVEWGD